MAYGGFKDLLKRTTYDKLLQYKVGNVEKNPKYNGYQRGLAQILLFKIFIKKSKDTTHRGAAIAFDSVPHSPFILYSPFKVNIWGNDFAYMQFISKSNKQV